MLCGWGAPHAAMEHMLRCQSNSLRLLSVTGGVLVQHNNQILVAPYAKCFDVRRVACCCKRLDAPLVIGDRSTEILVRVIYHATRESVCAGVLTVVWVLPQYWRLLVT